MYVFVKTQFNYADEFDLDCCFVQKREAFDADMAVIEQKFAAGKYQDREFYFGTNEYLEFFNFRDFVRHVHATICSDEFASEFITLTGGTFGVNFIERLVES